MALSAPDAGLLCPTCMFSVALEMMASGAESAVNSVNDNIVYGVGSAVDSGDGNRANGSESAINSGH